MVPQQSPSTVQACPAAEQHAMVPESSKQVGVVLQQSVSIVQASIAAEHGEGAQFPPNKFRIPRSHVIPPKLNGIRRLIQVPDMQSVPLLRGKQNPPSAVFVRQQPTPKPMVLVMAQYSVLLLHPVFTSVQRGSQKGRSSASAIGRVRKESLLHCQIIVVI